MSTDELACLKFEAGLNIEIQLGLAGREFSSLGAMADAAIKYEEVWTEKKRRENRKTGKFQPKVSGNKGNQN